MKISIKPSVLSILTTFQCTATCKNCCFGCNPQIKKKLTFEEVKTFIDQAITEFDSIKILVLTGGECFLLGNDLYDIINYASSLRLIVRVVTNGFWARSYNIAYETLKKLKNVGLREINFSTGDEHQEWVSYDNIVFGAMAAIDLELTCIINVETHDNSHFDPNSFIRDCRLKSYFNASTHRAPLRIKLGAWVPFKKESNISYDNINLPQERIKQRCTSLFKVLSINPYSQLLACCGLTCEHIIPLRLGTITNNNLKSLYESQFLDLIKLWIFIDGPYSVLSTIYKGRGLNIKIQGHICHICAEIFKDNENIAYVQNHYKEIMPSIIFKYKLLQNTY